MNEREKQGILDFLANDRQCHSEKLFHLLNRLSLQLNYQLKIQRASIQLIHNAPFAVIGFRRRSNHFFVEFYNDRIIENNRIVTRQDKGNSLIIHTVNVSTLSDIDNDLLKWIKHSFELVQDGTPASTSKSTLNQQWPLS